MHTNHTSILSLFFCRYKRSNSNASHNNTDDSNARNKAGEGREEDREEISRLKQRNVALEQSLSEQKTALAASEKRVSQLRDSLHTAEKHTSASAYTAAQAEVSQLKERNVALQEALREQLAQHQETVSANTAAQEEISQLKQPVAELVSQGESSASATTAAQEEVS